MTRDRVSLQSEFRQLSDAASSGKALLLRLSLPLAGALAVASFGRMIASAISRSRVFHYKTAAPRSSANIEAGLAIVAKVGLTIRIARTVVSRYNTVAPNGTLTKFVGSRPLLTRLGSRAGRPSKNSNEE